MVASSVGFCGLSGNRNHEADDDDDDDDDTVRALFTLCFVSACLNEVNGDYDEADASVAHIRG